MTFDSRERSLFQRRPIALLELTRGGLIERYTNADRIIPVGADNYAPLSLMKRSEIADTGERAKGVLTIELPIDAPCYDWFYPVKRTAIIGVVSKTFHYGDAEVATEWIGRVVSRARNDTTLFLSCEQRSSRARSVGMNLCVMRGCPLVVYSPGRGMCQLNPDDFAVPATLSAVDATTITSAAFGSAPLDLSGGYFEWEAGDGEIESRSILTHDGNDVVLDYASVLLEAGVAGIAYPGCAGDWEACEARENTDNYGGCPNLPIKTPYDGNPR
jgi:hypothetical protein